MTNENKRSAQRESCRGMRGRGGRKPVLPSPPLAAWPPFARLHPPPPSAQTYRRSQRAIFAKVPGSYEMAVPMASFDSLRGILLFRLLQFPRACATYSIITHAEMRISAPRKGRGKKRRRYPEYVSFTREASARINATHIYILLIAFSSITTWQLSPIILLLRKPTRLRLILSPRNCRLLIESCRLAHASIFLVYIRGTFELVGTEPTSAGVTRQCTRESWTFLNQRKNLASRASYDYRAEM